MSDQHPHPVDPERVAQVRRALITAEQADRVAALLRLLGDPVRARILHALSITGELCVGDIALALEIGESSVSYALRILRTAGLVQPRREGRMVYYRLTNGSTDAVLELFRSHGG